MRPDRPSQAEMRFAVAEVRPLEADFDAVVRTHGDNLLHGLALQAEQKTAEAMRDLCQHWIAEIKAVYTEKFGQ